MGRARNAAPKNLRKRLLAYRSHLVEAFETTRVFVTRGERKTAAQLIADIDAALKPFVDVDLQRVALNTVLLARKRAEPKARAIGDRTVDVIRGAYRHDDPILKATPFLRHPGGPHEQTSGQKVIANAKRQKTRKAVGVMGKRQRAAKRKGG